MYSGRVEVSRCVEDNFTAPMVKPLITAVEQMLAAQNLAVGLFRYTNDFVTPFLIASYYFNRTESDFLFRYSPEENLQSYEALFDFNLDLMFKAVTASLKSMEVYTNPEIKQFVASLYNTVFQLKGEKLEEFFSRQAERIDNLTQKYPEAILDIEPEYGFHFERKENALVAETDRFILYQIMPTEPGVRVRKDGKPLFIIPPFVLGSNILAFLPGDRRSYAHSFANQGVPTYIRIMKDIQTTPAFQVMTMEDDAADTRYFCETIRKRHGKPVTLNGYCQGGYTAVCNILSNELDGLVDALITCVSPMDGTRSTGLGNFLKSLPPKFNDLVYGTKTLSNGNRVADGNLMGWVYKLKSIEKEAPLVSFFRDLSMVSPPRGRPMEISKTAAALNYWLQKERSDIPLAITEMSFASYNIPVTDDGTLPVKMFNRTLNFKGISEKKIPWLICFGEHDDLVEKETALAPLDYVAAEVTPFPKGHVAIATSWSHPDAECALHKRFGKNKSRGPVRFQLDLDEALNKSSKTKKPGTKRSKTAKKATAAQKTTRVKSTAVKK